jgi:hypothetical protein
MRDELASAEPGDPVMAGRSTCSTPRLCRGVAMEETA